MLLDYGDCAGLTARSQPVKRNNDQRERDLIPCLQPCAKKPKIEPASGFWQLQEGQLLEDRPAELGFLTPAATPADGDFSATQPRAASPYSEAEDYMVQGYYQDDLLAHERRPCVESLQYNLYDMTPEEFELIDAGEHERQEESSMDGAHAGWQPAFNDTVYDESYDIDM